MKLNQAMLAIAFIMISAGCGGRNKYKTNPGSVDDRKKTESPSRIEEDEKQPDNTYGFTSNDGTNKNENQPMVGAFSSSANMDTTMVYLKGENDSKYNPLPPSSTTMGNDGVRKFIKTADLKFRVKSVIRATYDIEDITHQFGGFVA